MTPLYLSRARLRSRRGEALAAIAPLLIPDDASQRVGHGHRILWLLFQDGPDTKRDFLWRDERDGRFMILSRRPPHDPHQLFEVETKPFEPALAVGDRLRFALRANPVVARKAAAAPSSGARQVRGKRVDVVMDALKHIPPTDRAARTGRAFERDRLIVSAGREWLERQGAKHGFRLTNSTPLEIGGYTQVALERRGKRPAGFSTLDFSGEIQITDPAAFLARIAHGFGSAKAFGNGLMLIRRA
jgi:CRISPR system Cascade subunit CasE